LNLIGTGNDKNENKSGAVFPVCVYLPMPESQFNTPSPLQQVCYSPLNKRNITLYIKRDDRIHDEVSGNKWRKLKLNIEQAQQKGYDTLLTFGGAHSNHIAATAATAAIFGLKSIGIIRGEDADPENPTLKFAAEKGMQLKFVSRSDYDTLQSWESKEILKEEFGSFYAIPQGGANLYGAQGCMDIIYEIDMDVDRIFVACGTATTLSGMAIAAAGKIDIYGISVLKGGGFLIKEIEKNLHEVYQDIETERFVREKTHLLLPYHFGGYAKTTPELIAFMQEFTSETDIKLDPVYTAKAAYAMRKLAGNLNDFRPEKWILIHTGGLQGIPAMERKLGYSIY